MRWVCAPWAGPDYFIGQLAEGRVDFVPQAEISAAARLRYNFSFGPLMDFTSLRPVVLVRRAWRCSQRGAALPVRRAVHVGSCRSLTGGGPAGVHAAADQQCVLLLHASQLSNYWPQVQPRGGGDG